jgi:hypothetical protein
VILPATRVFLAIIVDFEKQNPNPTLGRFLYICFLNTKPKAETY